MTLTDIEGAWNKVPFLPFNVHLENGRVFHVPHPDFLFLSPCKRMASIADGETFHVVDVERIQFLEFRSAAS